MFGTIMLSRTREIGSIATETMVVANLVVISQFPGGCVMFCSCGVYFSRKAARTPFLMGLLCSITHVPGVLSLMVRSRNAGLAVIKPAVPVGEFIGLIYDR
jgi:hypothetical protein